MVMPYIQLAMERSKKDWMKTVGKQRDGRDQASPKPQPVLHYCKTSIYFMFFHFSQLNLRIIGILTKSYKITIDCFKPTISVGFDPYSRKVLLGQPSALAG